MMCTGEQQQKMANFFYKQTKPGPLFTLLFIKWNETFSRRAADRDETVVYFEDLIAHTNPFSNKASCKTWWELGNKPSKICFYVE